MFYISFLTFCADVGLGVHHTNPALQPELNFWQSLVGLIQTVARAERTAVVIVARNAGLAAKIISFSDGEVTKVNFNKGLDRARFANNSTLRVKFFKSISTKFLELHVWWEPSHTDKEPTKLAKALSWMKEWRAKGNNIADGMPGTAADLHRAPAEHASLSSTLPTT